MSGAAREKDQADFDLERFVDMFDEAMTSRDPRVVDALRGLMMIVTLTRPESHSSGRHDRNSGPLRRLYEDMNHINNRMHRVEEEFRSLQHRYVRNETEELRYKYPYETYTQSARAQSIDQDMLEKMKNLASAKIKGLYDK